MIGSMGILLAAVLVSGCSETTAPPIGGATEEPQAPALPTAEVMQFDFGFFGMPADAAGRTQEVGMVDEPCLQRHWFNAVVRVAAIELLVAAGMAPPTAAFAAAVHTPPSYLGELTWLWIYTWVEAGGEEMQVRLQGQLLEDEDAVAWSLRVSSTATSPPLEQALWFEGQSPIGYGAGYWVIYDLAQEPPLPVVRLDYVNPSDAENELIFENIYAGEEGFGDTLRFHELDDFCTLEFFDASADQVARITWDEIEGGGSIECPDYNDGEQGCWTAERCDCECPESDPS
jgi:hypothetical protein